MGNRLDTKEDPATIRIRVPFSRHSRLGKQHLAAVMV
jgi:hypothetical protein